MRIDYADILTLQAVTMLMEAIKKMSLIVENICFNKGQKGGNNSKNVAFFFSKEPVEFCDR